MLHLPSLISIELLKPPTLIFPPLIVRQSLSELVPSILIPSEVQVPPLIVSEPLIAMESQDGPLDKENHQIKGLVPLYPTVIHLDHIQFRISKKRRSYALLACLLEHSKNLHTCETLSLYFPE